MYVLESVGGEDKGDKQILVDGIDFCKNIAAKFKDSITHELIAAIANIEALESGNVGQNEIATGTSQIGEVSCIKWEMRVHIHLTIKI